MEHSSVFTGQNYPILPKLQDCIKRSKKIYFVVSFIRDSGAKLINNSLVEAIKAGKEVKIITSDYLNVTEPNALYRLSKEINDIRIFDNDKNNGISFHPKTYIFEYEDGEGEILIGSSNISYSALLKGVEWNFAFKKSDNQNEFDKFMKEFFELYEKNSFALTLDWLRKYEKNYIKNNHVIDAIPNGNNDEIYPIKFQIPALYELSKTREEGYNKAMVVVATGLGKTYLSAFDTLNYNKVLFVAHRKEILQQAMKTFKKIHPNKSMGIFDGNSKDTNKDIIFANINTLGKSGYHNENYFNKNYFDYIIIDEFHHAGADLYEKLMEYFTPKFLLGLTATPDRMDNKDIYKWCDYNIAYECNFKIGINNGWLVPFDYYGLYDEINYDLIPWRSGKYDIYELENKLMVEERTNQIIEKFKIYARKKVIAFCASVKHAEYMSKAFNKARIKSDVVVSDPSITSNRGEVISAFENNDLRVIFTVDIFNEGIDIPSIDTVLFLRPTNSYTIFIQQLGRGLRTKEGKEKLTVIDMVGNYKGAELKPLFLSGNYDPHNIRTQAKLPMDLSFPEGCNANFDLRIIDYFSKSINTRMPFKEKLKNEFNEIKENLGRRPSLMEVFNSSNYGLNVYIREFKGWMNFLEIVGELTESEQNYKNSLAGEFLYELEITSMTKSYKIPAILSLLKNGKFLDNVKSEIIGAKFKEFYHCDFHKIDFNNKIHLNYKQWNSEHFTDLAVKNPVKFLSKSKFFDYDEKIKTFKISSDYLADLRKYSLEKEVEERLDYRNKNYFKRKYGVEI